MKLSKIEHIHQLLKADVREKLNDKERTKRNIDFIEQRIEEGINAEETLEKFKKFYSERVEAYFEAVNALEDFENHDFS